LNEQKTIKVRTEVSKEELIEGKVLTKIKINCARFNRSCWVLLKFPQNIIVSYPNKIINITQHYCQNMEEKECME
jgi:phosphoribosylglycinamide formyltransferase-1